MGKHLEYVWTWRCLREQVIFSCGQTQGKKVTETILLTCRASEHDGEQVDTHGYGVEDRQGPQPVRNRVFLDDGGKKKNPVHISLYELVHTSESGYH